MLTNIVQAGVALGVKLITGLVGATKRGTLHSMRLTCQSHHPGRGSVLRRLRGRDLSACQELDLAAAVVNVWNTISASVGSAIQISCRLVRSTAGAYFMAALGNWWQSIKDWFANTFSFGEVPIKCAPNRNDPILHCCGRSARRSWILPAVAGSEGPSPIWTVLERGLWARSSAALSRPVRPSWRRLLGDVVLVAQAAC